MSPPVLRTYANKKKSQRQNKQCIASYVKPNMNKILTDSSNYDLRNRHGSNYMLRSKKIFISPLPSTSTVSSTYDTDSSIHVALPETTFDRLKNGENAMKKTTISKACISSSLDTSSISKTSFESFTKNRMNKKKADKNLLYETSSFVSNKSEYLESLLCEKEQRPVQKSLTFSPYVSVEQKSNTDDFCNTKDQIIFENNVSLNVLSTTGPVVSTPILSSANSKTFMHGDTSPIVKVTKYDKCVTFSKRFPRVLLETLPGTENNKCKAFSDRSPRVLLERLSGTYNVSKNIYGIHTKNVKRLKRDSKYTPKINNRFDDDSSIFRVKKRRNKLKLSIKNRSSIKNKNDTEKRLQQNSSGNGLGSNECDTMKKTINENITDCTPLKVDKKKNIAVNLSLKYFSDDSSSIEKQRIKQRTKNSSSDNQHSEKNCSETHDDLNDKTKDSIDHVIREFQKKNCSRNSLFTPSDNVPLSNFITVRHKDERKHSNNEMNSNRKSDKNTTTEILIIDTPDFKSDALKSNMSEENVPELDLEVITIDSSLESKDTSVCQNIKDENSDRSCILSSPKLFLTPGKKWRRQLSILTADCDIFNVPESVKKGRKWRKSVDELLQQQKSKNDTCTRNSNHKKDFVRMSQRRATIALPKNFIRILPISTPDNCSLKSSQVESSFSLLQAYAQSGYVPQQIDGLSTGCESGLESDFTNLSVKPTVTAEDIVLDRCKQTQPEDFLHVYPDSILQKCLKIGEGVYGEVFLFKASDGRATVMKVIPIEGDLKINGDYQKKYSEIVVEIIITQELSNLRLNKCNGTSCFAEVQAVQCVQGKYPQRLLELWDLYDEQSGSENDRPDFFPANQQYIVLELAHAGRDLEAYVFDSAEQAYSIFLQTAYALAVAEAACQFEHRDLHWGNLMITPTEDREISFWLNNEELTVPTKGVKATIIDFTLSRITYDGACLFFDLAKEDDLFQSEGDHQFDVYRLMKQHNRNNWETFKPYTNILWLHYIIKKMIDGVRYLKDRKKSHKVYIKKMIELELIVLSFDSARNFVNNLKEIMF